MDTDKLFVVNIMGKRVRYWCLSLLYPLKTNEMLYYKILISTCLKRVANI